MSVIPGTLTTSSALLSEALTLQIRQLESELRDTRQVGQNKDIRIRQLEGELGERTQDLHQAMIRIFELLRVMSGREQEVIGLRAIGERRETLIDYQASEITDLNHQVNLLQTRIWTPRTS